MFKIIYNLFFFRLGRENYDSQDPDSYRAEAG